MLGPPPNRTCTFQRIRLSTTACYPPLAVGWLTGVDAIVASDAEDRTLALPCRPHVAGQPGILHLRDPADVMDLTGKVIPTTTLALAGVESFDQLRSAEHELGGAGIIDPAPRSDMSSQVLQLS